ncbi:ETS homologous factor isoform X2 [Sander vitreus]
MSVTPSTTLDSQLTTTWGTTNSYPDVPMVMSGYTSRLWPCDSQPQFWSKYQVWEWLQQVMDMHQMDVSSVPFQNFDMDGHQLCSLSYQDFLRAAGSVGPILFHSITELKWSGQYHVEIGQLELKPEYFSCPFPDVSYPPGEIYDPLNHPLTPASPNPSSPGPRVWRKRGEAQNPHCLKSSVKFPQSVMVWGAMSSAGVGPLCFLRSRVNAAVQEVLEHFMRPAADQLHGDADFIFQQDLAPSHSAKATSTWFKDHGIPVLNWPANSPHLNPIENLWGIVKRMMRCARPNNAEELKATIRATWALITPEQCHRLIDSMPRRIAAVIQAKRAPTKYRVLYMLILFMFILFSWPTFLKILFCIGLK